MVTENDKVRKAYRQGELLFLPLNEEDTAKIGHVPKSASYPCWNALLRQTFFAKERQQVTSTRY